MDGAPADGEAFSRMRVELLHPRTRFRVFGIVALVSATSMCAPQSPAPAPEPASGPASGPPTRAAAGGGRGGRPSAYPVRPPAPPAQVAHGQQLFKSNCSFCHGSDARGGESGPNLVRAQLVLDDQHGELITPVIQSGIPAQGMPKFDLSAGDIADIAAWLHDQPMSNRGAPSTLDILVGNANDGKAYFTGAGGCTRCHSATGDLAGIGGKYDPKTIQDLIVSGGAGGSVGRRPAGSAPPPEVPPTTVTVTLPSGQTVQGDLDHPSAFVVALTEPDGTYKSFARHGSTPTIVVTNPLQWHVDMLRKWQDSDLHNLTAYLVTLK
jgi:cytochrome c oxidase cbb3-type subunit III